MADTTGVVPLPDHLLTCGCPHAQMGTHKTSCIPAREHDAKPLRDRPEFELGRRFRAISWEYPLRLTANVDYTVELDPVAFFAAHQEEYDAFELESGYEPWEKPMVFLSSKMEEGVDELAATWIFGTRNVARVRAHMDFVSEYPRWEPADTDRLIAKPEPAPEVVIDPNQGDLFGAPDEG